jgi:hypothetical protein
MIGKKINAIPPNTIPKIENVLFSFVFVMSPSPFLD